MYLIFNYRLCIPGTDKTEMNGHLITLFGHQFDFDTALLEQRGLLFTLARFVLRNLVYQILKFCNNNHENN